LCKHQVAIFLTCIEFTKENIIQYCWTWYGSDRGGFAAMFADPTYLHIYDNESDDEKADEDHNQPSSSSTSTEKTLAQMGDIMQ
jgi:hypothetical protein